MNPHGVESVSDDRAVVVLADESGNVDCSVAKDRREDRIMPNTKNRAVFVVWRAMWTEAWNSGDNSRSERQKQAPEHEHHSSSEESNDRAVA